MSDKLNTNQVYGKLKATDFRGFGKPKRNKGARGQLIELALGIPNSSKLTDLIDGELKTFTVGQTIYVGFTKDNDHVGTKIVNSELDPQHYQQLAEDYGYIAANIKVAYENGATLHTITGPNNLLQIRTKASKNNYGEYTPLCYNGVELKDKYMAFYLLSDFGKQVLK